MSTNDNTIVGTTMCPACQATLKVRRKHAHTEGATIRCPRCKEPFTCQITPVKVVPPQIAPPAEQAADAPKATEPARVLEPATAAASLLPVSELPPTQVKPLPILPPPIPQYPKARPNSKLRPCAECGHEISKKATTCPQCGAKIKQTSPVAMSCLVLVLLFGGLTIIGGIMGGSSTTTSTTQTTSRSSEWYSGGTLHRSKVVQWNKTTYQNKLATSADWASTNPKIKNLVMKSGSMDKLRPFAEELLTCINEAVAGKNSEGLNTSEFATACMILMDWR